MMDMTKGLTSTGNIVAETPGYLFDRLSQIFNFTVDVCALPENAKCERFYTPDDDGLSNVYVILLCPILRHYAMCPPAYIYNCVGLYRHTQVYIYIIYNNNIYFYALL